MHVHMQLQHILRNLLTEAASILGHSLEGLQKRPRDTGLEQHGLPATLPGSGHTEVLKNRDDFLTNVYMLLL